jgi:uncharacterized membrane protein
MEQQSFMDQMVTGWNTWADPIARWIHVGAGIMWIGHLWFFNFVNAQIAKTYDAESKKKVLPELMPRALYWFRWGALYTWITGVLMLGYNFSMSGVLLRDGATMSKGAAAFTGLAIVLFGFFAYDALWKFAFAKNELVGAIVSFLLVVAVAFFFHQVLGFSSRAVAIHIGAMFGNAMMMNVWMRIWPAQRKIIAGVKGTGPAPDAAVPALAGLRSKHNTYMSVPLVLFMLNMHATRYIDIDLGGTAAPWLMVAIIVGIGWGAVKFLYTKSASAAPTGF